MSIKFEFTLDFWNPFKYIPKIICWGFDHIWEKEEEDFYPSISMMLWRSSKIVDQRCKRCGAVTWKKREEEKPKTVKFSRYKKLKKGKKK